MPTDPSDPSDPYLSTVATRADFLGRFDGTSRTPQGGIRTTANLTRTGIFLYKDSRGQTVREWRPPEEVFHADSLATLHLAPIVVGHPDMVRTDNYKDLNVGAVGESKPSGIFVAAPVVINDADTVEKIDNKELCELSCGYEVDLDPTPGTTPEGEKYDAIQRNIRYNHVGLGPAGWGRAGSDVRLHLDSGGLEDALRLDSAGNVVLDSYSAGMPTAENKEKEIISGARFDAEVSRADKAEARVEALTAELAASKTKCDALEAELVGAKALNGNLIDPSTVPALVAARVALENSARAILGADFKAEKTDGDKTVPMTDAELVLATIAKHDPKYKTDGRTAEYLRARFDHITDAAIGSIEANAALGTSIKTVTAPKVDAAGAPVKSKLDAAYEAAEAERLELAKGGPPRGAVTRKA